MSDKYVDVGGVWLPVDLFLHGSGGRTAAGGSIFKGKWGKG